MTLIDLWHDERLDQSETLTFIIPADDPKADLVVEDAEVRWRDRVFYMNEPTVQRDGPTTRLTVECEALWYRLGDKTHIGSLVLTSVTVAAGLATILAPTGWTVADQTTARVDTYSLEMQDKTALAWVREWAKVTGTYVLFDTQARQVALVDARGADLGIGFRYGRNMTQIKRKSRKPECTRLFPFGADSLTIAGVNGGKAYLEDLSFYTAGGLSLEQARERFTRSRPWSDTSFTDEAALLAEAQRRFAGMSQPTLSYELTVLDLTELTGWDEDYELADTVRVTDAPLGIDVRTTVVRRVRYPLQPWRNVVELAYLPVPAALTATSARSSSAESWQQFVAPVDFDFPIRNNATYTVSRLSLRFRDGGYGHLHLQLFATGVGDGVMHVEVYDSVAAAVVWEAIDVPYTDDELVCATLGWAADPLSGPYDWRVRVSTTADGGPSPALGVDVAESTPGEAPFYAMVVGAVRETPTDPESVTFEYTGAVQQWTVPDNVEGPITISAAGGKGARTDGGDGLQIVASFPSVTPGEVYDVYVAGGTGVSGGGVRPAGWPNGGLGGAGTPAGSPGGGGGGSSYVTPAGGTIADALLVAPGGGGGVGNAGGAAGYFAGDDGEDGSALGGGGATQFAGGAGGSGGESGTFGQGGAGEAGSSLLGDGGGAGGGGWYGGGGGGGTGAVQGAGEGGGGGGSGYVRSDGYDLLFSPSSARDTQLVISWETPSTV